MTKKNHTVLCEVVSLAAVSSVVTQRDETKNGCEGEKESIPACEMALTCCRPSKDEAARIENASRGESVGKKPVLSESFS